MIREAVCDRCGAKIKLAIGQMPLTYLKLIKPRQVCMKCAPIIEVADKKLDKKFKAIMLELDKELFPNADNVVEIKSKEDEDGQ